MFLFIQRQRVFLFGSHLRLCLRCLISLTGEMQHAVDEDAEKLGIKGNANHLGIGAHGFQGNENIAVQGLPCRVIKGDDIRVVVVSEKLAVDL